MNRMKYDQSKMEEFSDMYILGKFQESHHHFYLTSSTTTSILNLAIE